MISVLHLIAYATEWIYSPTPAPQNKNQGAMSELNPGKQEWGITKGYPGMQRVREELKESDWRLILQTFLYGTCGNGDKILPDVRPTINNYKAYECQLFWCLPGTPLFF